MKKPKEEKPKWIWETKTVKRQLVFDINNKRIFKVGNVKMHLKMRNEEIISVGKRIPSTSYILVNKKGFHLSVSNNLHFLWKQMIKDD